MDLERLCFALRCLLLVAGSAAACGGPILSSAQAVTEGAQAAVHSSTVAQNDTTHRPRQHLVKQGLRVLPLQTPMRLAQEARLPIELTRSGSIDSIYLTQKLCVARCDDPSGEATYEFIHDGFSQPQVRYNSDGSAYLEVVPRRMGTVRFDILLSFSDGAFLRLSVDETVGRPASVPLDISVTNNNLGGPSFQIRTALLGKDGSRGRVFLPMFAKFAGEKNTFEIDEPYITQRIRQARNEVILEHGETPGSLFGVQKGQALVTSSFEGWQVLTCVVVHDRGPETGAFSDGCSSLLRPGETLGIPFRVSSNTNGNP
jgi:hypothetical protein